MLRGDYREFFIKKGICEKKKYDKKILRLTKGMLRIATLIFMSV